MDNKNAEYKYYSTQRPVDSGTFPKAPIRVKNYDRRIEVEEGEFLAWGELVYDRPLTEEEMESYELRFSRETLDVQAQIIGKWEDICHITDGNRLTWYCSESGMYVLKDHVEPQQLVNIARTLQDRERKEREGNGATDNL